MFLSSRELCIVDYLVPIVNCSYYDQLCALEGKIPAHELQIPFKWKDAFDRTIFGGKLSLSKQLMFQFLQFIKICVSDKSIICLNFKRHFIQLNSVIILD